MERIDEMNLLVRLRDCLDQKTTAMVPDLMRISTDRYFSEEHLIQEQELLFDPNPLVAGLSSDLAEPGSFMTLQMGRVPVLLVRADDGNVRAFLNACRHRGTRLACEQAGKTKLFVCPFHAWSFNRAGELVGMPEEHTFGEVDRAALGLATLPCEERHGLIWVKPSGKGGMSVEEFLGDLGPELRDWRLGREPPIGFRSIRRRINWKLAVDTFGETYHFNVLHRNSVSLFFHANRSTYDLFGPHHRMSFIAKTIGALDEVPKESWALRPHALLAYYIYPNTQLLVQPDGVTLFRIFPDRSASESVTHVSFYPRTVPQSDEERAYYQMSFERTCDVIDNEDYAQAETMQLNFESGGLNEIVFGRNEPALHHYHSTYAKALSQGAAG